MRLVKARQLELVARYRAEESSVKDRVTFERMMREAHEGLFTVLVIWSLDRFGRSMVGNLQAVLELDSSIASAWR
jgi:DNA invertase Pin-like site-specific DNA recombinase